MKISFRFIVAQRIGRWLQPALLALLFSGIPHSLQAEEVVVQSNFSGGDVQSAPDDFPGSAGNGWLEPWRVIRPSNPHELFTFNVLEEDPLPGFSRYLRIETQKPQQFISMARSLDRSVLDPAKPHTVSFILRLDALDPPDGEFRFKVTSSQEGDFGISDSFWYVLSQNGFWYLVGKKEDGETRWVKSPVSLRLGVAYSFTVEVNPEAKTFQVNIQDGTDEFNSPVMNSHSDQAQEGAGTLIFEGSVVRQPDGAPFTWSLGGVEIHGSK